LVKDYKKVVLGDREFSRVDLALSFDANFTAAQEKADIIRQYLATQA
jgi:hypothetical protein